jgi:hypothetical protein
LGIAKLLTEFRQRLQQQRATSRPHSARDDISCPLGLRIGRGAGGVNEGPEREEAYETSINRALREYAAQHDHD